MLEFEAFRRDVNLLFVVDHAGRAGNGFFQTIFDLHPQVLACPWMHYVYSYVITEFGDDEHLDAHAVWELWRETAYFELLYHELDESRSAFIRRMGGDPSAELDRGAVRQTFDALLLSSSTISRLDLVLAIFYSYALGRGLDPAKVRYILCPDSISLRGESAMTGFSGKVVDIALHDFPHARLIHLERDPRAGFASSTHQFVNQLGNMYGLRTGQFFKRLGRLRRREIDWDSVFVFGFWLIYFRQTYKSIMRKREEYPTRFLTVRNEDLNLNFVPTMRALATDLDIEMLEKWTADFVPTMLGKPWTGTGAYNNQYQTNQHGPLKNDPDSIARRVSGPNAYVTTRWRKRMKKNEILIVEALLEEEISQFGYDFLYWKKSADRRVDLYGALWRPLSGELPTPRWIADGLRIGMGDFIERLFYLFAFPVFYVQARLTFCSIVEEGHIFELCEQ
jgi:hypothetical protein